MIKSRDGVKEPAYSANGTEVTTANASCHDSRKSFLIPTSGIDEL